jgi:hypothetical protein
MRHLALALLATAVAIEDSLHTVADKVSDVRAAAEALIDKLPDIDSGRNIEAIVTPLPNVHERADDFVARGGVIGGDGIGFDYIYVGWAAPGSVMPQPDEGEVYGDYLARGGLLVEGPNGEHLPASHVFDGSNWIPA